MVSTERRQRAQIEEELQNVRQEREALKGALRIVEGENTTLRSGVQGVTVARPAHRASASDASSSSRDRRVLTIDTDKAFGQGEGSRESGIDLTQTPSTSELPNRSGGQTPTSTVNINPNAALIGGPGVAAETGNTLPQPRKSTGESGGSQATGFNHLPRGTLSFGM
jgi:hypothetical protein